MATRRPAAIAHRIAVAAAFVALSCASRESIAQRVRWRSSPRPSAPLDYSGRNRLRFGIATVGSVLIPAYDWTRTGINYPTFGGGGLAVDVGRTLVSSRVASVAVLGEFSLTTMVWFTDVRLAALAEYVYGGIFGVAGGFAGGIQFTRENLDPVRGQLNATLPLRFTGYFGYGGESWRHAFSASIEFAPGIVWDWAAARGFVAVELMAGLGYTFR